jgi:ribosomal protein L11 methyltransferase
VAFVALCFDTDALSADEWGDALLEAGALSVDVADPHASTAAEVALYDEPGSEAALWPTCRLTALFSSSESINNVLREFASAGRTVPPYETRVIEDLDWVRATQAQFAPQRISDRLWIVPSWCKPPVEGAINLILDPGLAFGTGSHPTTRLCLRWLERELESGETVLDYGCGSGILAIAADRLGASTVVGTDIDPQALMASRANAERNGSTATFVPPEQLASAHAGDFDVVVANILANPLTLLAPVLARKVRDDGRLVLSGILEPQAEAVMTAYRRWFNIAVYEIEDGWLALAGKRDLITIE